MNVYCAGVGVLIYAVVNQMLLLKSNPLLVRIQLKNPP